MNPPKKKYSRGRKILIGVLIFIGLLAIGFHFFVTYYLPPIVKQRLSDIIVKGSDSLYRFQVGKFDVSFWGGTVQFSDMHITIDSARYKSMRERKKLPPMTFEMTLGKGNVDGLSLSDLIFSKKIDIRHIFFNNADVQLSRHFRTSEEPEEKDVPLWKLIQPGIRSIKVDGVKCNNLKVNYHNVDSARNFSWRFDKCNVAFTNILVDSASSVDSTRLLFAKNVAISASNVNMKTADGLYNLAADNILYSSANRSLEASQFEFVPALSEKQFLKHWGYQHEIYKLRMPVIQVKGFQLPQWISYNRLVADTIALLSPNISVSMNRNMPPNPHSKKGQYPHQLLQKAPFIVNVKRITAVDGNLVYTETNDKTQLTGKVHFPGIRGFIDNVTNDPLMVANSSQCVVNLRSGVMQSGSMHAIFRFNLADRSGAFSVNATVTKLDAAQLRVLGKAMTAAELQTFNMQKLEYSLSGNENAGKSNLRMLYNDMDILINKVEPDKSLDKKGFLSFLANRLVIYKANPMDDETERVATNMAVQRDPTKSFFNFVWKALYSSAGEIVIRPAAQRKMDKRSERKERRAERQAKREAKREARKEKKEASSG